MSTVLPERRALWVRGVLMLSVSCASVPMETRRAIHGIVEPITAESCRGELAGFLALGPRSALDEGQTTRVLEYLEGRLVELGYQPRRESIGVYSAFEQFNLIVELPGRVHPEQVIELGAHYDSVARSPGADDNGSGVCGLLQVAAALRGHIPEKTIRLCLFAAEEYGLVGSRVHVERLGERPDETVQGIVVLEMIGFTSHEKNSQRAPIRIPIFASLPRTGNFILVAGNFRSGSLGNIYERCARRYEPDLRFYSANRIAGFFSDAARSDHSRYWEAGLPGIMISDTADFRNPHYHRATDTLETIDFEFMASVTRVTAATIVEWGGRVPPRSPAGISESRPAGDEQLDHAALEAHPECPTMGSNEEREPSPAEEVPGSVVLRAAPDYLSGSLQTPPPK